MRAQEVIEFLKREDAEVVIQGNSYSGALERARAVVVTNPNPYGSWMSAPSVSTKSDLHNERRILVPVYEATSFAVLDEGLQEPCLIRLGEQARSRTEVKCNYGDRPCLLFEIAENGFERAWISGSLCLMVGLNSTQ